MMQHPTHRLPPPFSTLDALLAEPFPRPPQDRMQLEPQLSTAAAQTAAQIMLIQVTRAHADEALVRQAIAQARAQRAVRLVHKGWRTTSVGRLGGPRLILAPPYLREDRRGRRGRRRGKRGARGTGGSPVLEGLGIAERVSPASRSESARPMVQAASDLAAAPMLSRRGLIGEGASLGRITTATAEARTRLRAAALEAALRLPVPADGPLAGKRVRSRLAGGRGRTRRPPRGRKTATGRHGFAAPWREPRGLVRDLLDEQGQPERLRLPLYEVLLGNAEAVWALLIGDVRLLSAALAEVVECSADGAEWSWHRVERLHTRAEMPAAKVVAGLDFSHARQYLSETSAPCHTMPKAQRHALYKRLRHAVRPPAEGVEVGQEAWRALATPHRSQALTRALGSLEPHAHRMRYVRLEARKLSSGSGQVERAVRRGVKLRFKAPGALWTETTLRALMPLRAAFQAGRWDEIMRGVMTGTFPVPSFEPVDRPVSQRSAAVQERETSQTFVTPRQEAAEGAPCLPIGPP
jgi:hypothetical protein